MNRTFFVALFGFVALSCAEAPYRIAWAGCAPDQHQSFLCGDGKDAIRVFPQTISPSAKFGFGWRTSAGLPAGQVEPAADVENVLVRLTDGAVVGRLGGSYWDSGEMRANRYDLIAAWSPDSRAVVEVANSRWDTESFRFYAIGDADSVTLDLHELVERAVRAQSPQRAAKGRVFRVREDLPVKLDADGRLTFAAILFIPKSEQPALGFRLELMIKIIKSSAAARIISVQRAKLPD
ncbi:hypothetical protein SSBR45G_00350 [Bradyrhizobium sp. SSBR45G]|uniref:hypothetical protein n=1 Tax=unclassified Bradyrhizobium TaxID=2631580 RepID=UPI002342BBAE|nr:MULTISPECIES: hypothetical protein [unclassified Bradyrhizobium]GLH75127.1 hypothetical protein SSBR45G_00350 [Bradyrhizobium sp. SSBR45G]GLH83086.1 hypothetical protein SSBR45R_05460 [Bradyrhizobium sp. SSBR45R]